MKDYCTRFWCHDIYTGGSKPDLRLSQFTMQTELAPILWNGCEYNVLLMSEAGSGFLNIGFLADWRLSVLHEARSVMTSTAMDKSI